MRLFRKRNSERGAVIVMVAVWLPVLALFASFAIDIAHFFDYNRNLQNRADASALAAGLSLGSCLGSSGGATQSDIERTAQEYAGPPPNTPDANLPYSFGSVASYKNQPNLTQGKGAFFFMVLNGATSSDKGGTNFSDGHACSTDYTSPAGPGIDVWLTQKQLPLFFPLLGFKPNISAHARVQLQGEGSAPFVRPLAVSDPGAFSCATVKFFNSKTGALIASRDLTETDQNNLIFDNASNPVGVQIPTDDNGNGAFAYVYMQVFLSDCSGNGETFEDSSGVEVINSYGTAAPSSGQAPKIASGGVTLSVAGGNGATCTNAATDQYFSVGGCTVSPTANVTFGPDVTNPNQASVTAVDTSTGTSLSLRANGAGTVWTPSGNQGFTIGDSTGQHLIRIDWTQKKGFVGGQDCSATTCTGTFGIQQQSFGACNGCDQPDDSGPIVKSQIRLSTDLPGTFGQNAFQQGTTQQLVVTLQLAGIRAQSGGSAPPTILRFAGSTNHQTGLVDCGQGNAGGGSGTPDDAYTIYGGCGPGNPFEQPQCTNLGVNCKLPTLNPLFVYERGNPTNCSPAVDQDYTNWPSGNHQDCVQTTPGTRRLGIVCALVQRITGVTPTNFNASGGSACGTTCPANNWPNYNLVPGDARKIDVVLTAPVDLAAVAGTPSAWVPIRRFARFYVTGWDTGINPHCASNEAFPLKGKQTSDNGAIWGHWITDVDPGGLPDGNPCPTGSVEPITCVPALTR